MQPGFYKFGQFYTKQTIVVWKVFLGNNGYLRIWNGANSWLIHFYHNTESLSTSYLFELLQVFVQLQIVQDDGNEKTEQDLKHNTGTRLNCVPV